MKRISKLKHCGNVLLSFGIRTTSVVQKTILKNEGYKSVCAIRVHNHAADPAKVKCKQIISTM